MPWALFLGRGVRGASLPSALGLHIPREIPMIGVLKDWSLVSQSTFPKGACPHPGDQGAPYIPASLSEVLACLGESLKFFRSVPSPVEDGEDWWDDKGHLKRVPGA